MGRECRLRQAALVALAVQSQQPKQMYTFFQQDLDSTMGSVHLPRLAGMVHETLLYGA